MFPRVIAHHENVDLGRREVRVRLESRPDLVVRRVGRRRSPEVSRRVCMLTAIRPK